MSDYIKREDAINIKDYLKRFGCFGDYGFVEIEGVLIALSKIPSADVAPVRHGRWIELAMKGEFKCSVCGRGSKSENTFQLIPTVYWNYCPNCGARMDGDDNEID